MEHEVLFIYFFNPRRDSYRTKIHKLVLIFAQRANDGRARTDFRAAHKCKAEKTQISP